MNSAPLILICFAVAQEAQYFRLKTAGQAELRKLITGMGKKNAEASLRAELAVTHPRLVLSAGFAGGLRPGLHSGTVLFDRCELTPLARELIAAGAQPGRFVCCDTVCTTALEKKELRERTGADAVEMESEALGGLCREEQIPCATVRVILDTAEEDLPLDFNQLMTPDLRLDPRKLTAALVRAPGRIPSLLKLQKRSSAAARSLAQVLQSALSGLKV